MSSADGSVTYEEVKDMKTTIKGCEMQNGVILFKEVGIWV